MMDLFNEKMSQIKELDALKQKVTEDILTLYKERPSDMSLEQQWELFNFVQEYLPEHGYVMHNDLLDDYIGYDGPIYIERYQSLAFGAIVKDIEDFAEEYLEHLAEPFAYFDKSTIALVETLREHGADLLGIEEEEEYEAKARESIEVAINEIKKEFMETGYRGYVYQDEKNGRVSINFTLPKELQGWVLKGLDSRLLKCNSKQFELILSAYVETDGYRKGNSISITTAKKEEADLLSHLSVLSGYMCNVHFRIHGFSKTGIYDLTFTKKQIQMLEKPYLTECVHVDKEPFWCITVRNENFLMRRDGKISLTGNTHTAVDETVDGCRLVINPLGYPQEHDKNGYKPNLIIEV